MTVITLEDSFAVLPQQIIDQVNAVIATNGGLDKIKTLSLRERIAIGATVEAIVSTNGRAPDARYGGPDNKRGSAHQPLTVAALVVGYHFSSYGRMKALVTGADGGSLKGAIGTSPDVRDIARFGIEGVNTGAVAPNAAYERYREACRAHKAGDTTRITEIRRFAEHALTATARRTGRPYAEEFTRTVHSLDTAIGALERHLNGARLPKHIQEIPQATTEEIYRLARRFADIVTAYDTIVGTTKARTTANGKPPWSPGTTNPTTSTEGVPQA